jgi:hypothetical protein
LATSTAAAYITTSTRSSATSAPSSPGADDAAGDPAAASLLTFFFLAAIAASPSSSAGRDEAARGAAQEKPNLIGVLEATVPSPRDRPQRQTYNRARGTKEQTASQAARRDHAPQRPCLPPEQRQPTKPAHTRLDTGHILRHPGTGREAGRRTGSTPTAEHAGP